MPQPSSLNGGLRESGFRLTHPRRVIIQTLHDACGHMSADEIYTQLHDTYPRIGFTTVYRTLDLLVRLGLANKFEFGHGKARYEIKIKKHHHHLICRVCGTVVDCNDFIKEETRLIEKIEGKLSSKYTFAIQDHHLHFYGVCFSCQKER